MKIVMVNASPRKDGATAKVLNEFENQLKHEDIDITMFHLSDLEMNFCKGCCGCYKTGQCFMDDDAKILLNAISEAKGLIIGTPCYISDVSAQLKVFLDRGHFPIMQSLKDKHTLGIVTYENAGAGSAYKALNNLFAFSGAKSIDKLIIKTPLNSDPVKNNKFKGQIKRKAVNFYESMQHNKSSFICRITHFFALNFGIKPFVLKKGEAYQGVLDYWKESGVSHKAT